MNLRRLRILLTALCVVLTFFTAGVYSKVAYGQGRDRIQADTEREAEQELTNVLVVLKRGGQPKDSHTWWIRSDGNSTAYSETDVELPLRSLLKSSVDGGSFDTLTQKGSTYIVYTRRIADEEALVSIVDRSDEQDRLGSLRRNLVLGLLALTAVAGALGWFLSGRSLAPARRDLVERRGFLADAAHEMRTPLAVIQASASQALARPREQGEYVRSLSEIRSAAERAAAGVNELLDLARLESGQAIPRLAPLRLDLLAEEVAASVRADDCTLEASPSAVAVVVDADMALLRQAIDNVVRNATRRAGTVRLVTTVDGRDGVLAVEDDGPGFDPAVLPHVFDRYRRGDGKGEVGIGLSLVKAILAAHGGVAAAANRPEGGASVTLRVPLTRAGLG